MSFFNDVKDTVGDFVSYVGEVKAAVRAVNDGVNVVLADVVRNRRKANVVVVNETGGVARNVHVKHKYSSNFRFCRNMRSLLGQAPVSHTKT